MPAAFPIRGQINWQQSANARMAVALAISLVLHALIYAGWEVAPQAAAFFKDLGRIILPKKLIASPPKPKVEEPPPKREVPMTFVEVDPAHATPEPPKETKNYSTANSVAANPVPKAEEIPKVEGSQTRVVKMLEAPKLQPKPLEPSPPPPEPKPPEPKPPEPKPPEPKEVETKQPEPEPKPQPKPPPPGDLAMIKATPKMLMPSTKPEIEKPVETPRPRPRTLQEARARNPAIPGDKIKQEGGVQRRAHVSMLDARRTEFGDYDAAFISIVTARWYQLLDNNQYMMDRRGKVSLTFRLYQDGRISQVEVVENTVGDMLSLLCQKSVLDPSPFPPWPKEMRRQIKLQSNAEHRDVKFTFFYD